MEHYSIHSQLARPFEKKAEVATGEYEDSVKIDWATANLISASLEEYKELKSMSGINDDGSLDQIINTLKKAMGVSEDKSNIDGWLDQPYFEQGKEFDWGKPDPDGKYPA